jgi:hypothetical protein
MLDGEMCVLKIWKMLPLSQGSNSSKRMMILSTVGKIVIDVDGRSQYFGGQGLELPIGAGMVGDGAPGRH